MSWNTLQRIALVCPYSLAVPGGVQNHVLGLADWLGRQGLQSFVLAPELPGDDVRDRYRHTRIESSGPALPVPYNGSVARVSFDPFTARRVGQWLDRIRPDLLHLHEPITPSIALLGLRQVPDRVPVVATFHTATPGSRTMRLARRMMPAAIERIDAGIAVSPSAQRVARSHIGVESEVIGNGFDYAELAGAAPRPRRAPGPVLAFLGRLNESRKGLSTLIQAWPAIRDAHPRAQVLVAGSGTVRLPSEWSVLGQVSDTERSRLLRGADVFIAPHRARESFGLVLMEALAAGSQVVASDLPAFVDVLDDGAGPVATLFDTGDPADLARAVSAALGPAAPDPGRGAALAARYDWSVIGPRILRRYRAATGVAGAGLGAPITYAG